MARKMGLVLLAQAVFYVFLLVVLFPIIGGYIDTVAFVVAAVATVVVYGGPGELLDLCFPTGPAPQNLGTPLYFLGYFICSAAVYFVIMLVLTFGFKFVF